MGQDEKRKYNKTAKSLTQIIIKLILCMLFGALSRSHSPHLSYMHCILQATAFQNGTYNLQPIKKMLMTIEPLVYKNLSLVGSLKRSHTDSDATRRLGACIRYLLLGRRLLSICCFGYTCCLLDISISAAAAAAPAQCPLYTNLHSYWQRLAGSTL